MSQNNIKVLHIGDIHLGRDFTSNSVAGEDFSIRKEEIWDSFENSLAFAEKNSIEIVLISGDLFENESITKSNLDRLAFIFGKYHKLRFYIALGNHDYISIKSDYLKKISPNNVFIFSDFLEYKEYKNIRIYGYSWNKVEYNISPIKHFDLDNNFVNILLIHGTDSKLSNYLPLDINLLEGYGFNYIALGHIHEPKKVGKVSYYCGALEPMSFNNLGPHGGLVVTFTDKKAVTSFEKFASRNYQILDFDISGLVNIKSFFEKAFIQLKDFSTRDFIRLNIIGKKNKNLDLLEVETILLRKFKHLTLVDNTSPNFDFVKILEDNKENLIGKYFEFVFNNFDEKEQRELVEIGLNSFPLGDEYEI